MSDDANTKSRPDDDLGFTLTEMLVTMFVMMLVAATILGSMVTQTKTIGTQLAETEAQQNVRAALNVLKRAIRDSGWGMVSDPEAVGLVAASGCINPITALHSLQCDNQFVDSDGSQGHPAGSDSLRTVRIHPGLGGALVEQPIASNLGPNPSISLSFATASPEASAEHPLAVGELVLISGSCLGGGSILAGTDLLRVTEALPAGAGYDVAYRYNVVTQGVSAGQPMRCAAGYDVGFHFGRAEVRDFFVDHSDPTHPSLMMRTNPISGSPMSDAVLIARDIEDFQVYYHLDVGDDSSTDPDGVADLVCDALSPSVLVASGGCGLQATGFSLQQRAARTIGVSVVLVVRDYPLNPETASGAVPITVRNHTYLGDGDGYRRWAFRSTIALRNR